MRLEDAYEMGQQAGRAAKRGNWDYVRFLRKDIKDPELVEAYNDGYRSVSTPPRARDLR